MERLGRALKIRSSDRWIGAAQRSLPTQTRRDAIHHEVSVVPHAECVELPSAG